MGQSRIRPFVSSVADPRFKTEESYSVTDCIVRDWSGVERDAEDWQFCQEALTGVSRSFSQPILLLPEPLKVALTCGYLLCRVVDTIEDSVQLGQRRRDELFTWFVEVLEGARPEEELAQAFLKLDASLADIRLVQSLPRVMRVFRTQDEVFQRATVRWTVEMADGMRVYCHRDRPGTVNAVFSLVDLERYCYFVAGTVGHLITDLFVQYLQLDSSQELQLRRRCESFGIGLQMVNILKDISDDMERGRCYVPRELCREHGFEPEQLLDERYRRHAQEIVGALFRKAAQHLDDALEYTLTLPATATQLRLFCLLPLWMAWETLYIAVGNDALFTHGVPVKITRDTVADIVREAMKSAADDTQVRAHLAEVRTRFFAKLAADAQVEEVSQPSGRYVQA